MLALVVALYVVATAAGARQPSGGGGGGPSGSGLTQALGRVLVLPASSGDVVVPAGCGRGATLTLTKGQQCVYRLKSGFLAKRLRLSLTTGSALTAELVQPRPKVTDKETLDTAHPRIDLVYRQDGSTLTVTCGSDQKQSCAAKIG